MAPIAVPSLEELSIASSEKVKHVDLVNGEDAEEDDEEEVEGEMNGGTYTLISYY